MQHAATRAASAKNLEVCDWASDAVSGHATRGFRFLKGSGSVVDRASKGGDKALHVGSYCIQDACSVRDRLWSRQWTSKEPIGLDFVRAASSLRARAQAEDPMEPLTGEDLRTAARCLKRHTARGCDLMGPGDFLDAPPEAHEQLAQLHGQLLVQL